MPRIRKETSNRSSTNDRKKLHNRIRESRKKKAKAAKKNPQWKSKHKKDPGIPNNFPYKDEILKEVQEQRRLAEEEKIRRKEETKAARGQNTTHGEENSETAPEKLTPSQIGEGIADITARALSSKATKPPRPEVSEEEEEPPILLNRDLPHLKSVLDIADAVILVLDARDPLTYRSSHLEELIKGKHAMFVLTKIDMCPRESVVAWVKYLRTTYPTLLFRCSPEQAENQGTKKSKRKHLEDAWGASSVLGCLSDWSAKKADDDTPFTVAVVGVTNVGKSSFMNSLIRVPSLPVYSIASSSRGPTTTTHPQEFFIDMPGSKQRVRMIDTPGLFWATNETSEEQAEEAEATRVNDILARNKGRIDKLKEPVSAVTEIVSRCSAEDLMLFYNIPAFQKGNIDSFLSGVARSRQLVKKHGEPDIAGACRIVLRDWNTDRFPRYTMPPPNPSASLEQKLKYYEQDDEILQRLQTRKERRRGAGIAKLVSGKIDKRKVAFEMPWSVEENSVSDSDEDVEMGDASDEDEGNEEEDNEEEGNEEDLPLPLSATQKRKAKEMPNPQPKKKVAFAKADKKTTRSSSKHAAVAKKASKVMNVKSPSTASKPHEAGSEAYDFGKFF